MTPLMNWEMPGVEKNISRYARRLSADDSMSNRSSRLVTVDTVSSAARRPLPGVTSARAVSATLLVVVI